MSIQEKENKRQGTAEKAISCDKGGTNRLLKNVIEKNNSYSRGGCGGRRQEGLHLFESPRLLRQGVYGKLQQVTQERSRVSS